MVPVRAQSFSARYWRLCFEMHLWCCCYHSCERCGVSSAVTGCIQLSLVQTCMWTGLECYC